MTVGATLLFHLLQRYCTADNKRRSKTNHSPPTKSLEILLHYHQKYFLSLIKRDNQYRNQK